MVKILITGIGSAELGGIETLFRGLFIEKSKVFEISFLSFGNPPAFYKIYKKNGYHIYVLPTRRENPLAFSHNIRCFFEKHRDFDYIWVNTSSTSIYQIQYYGKKLTNAKVITHSHGTNFENSSGMLYHWGNKILSRLNKRKVLNNTDIFFGCSQAAGIALFGDEYKNNLIIIRNGIDTKRFAFNLFARNIIRNELNISENTIVFGMVGRLSPPKNILKGIKIFKEYHALIPDSLLLMIGDGPLREQAMQKAMELNIFNNVLFLGIRKDVEKLYSALDILLMPSYFEGLPLSAVEAQTSGLFCALSGEITDEVAITDLVHFIPLCKSEKEWARYILNTYRTPNNREDYSIYVINAGYDRKSTIEQLETLLKNNY